MTTRIDALCAADRALLRWASVLGQAFRGDARGRGARGRGRGGRLGRLGPARPSSSSATRTWPAASASGRRSSATRRTRACRSVAARELHARAAVEFERAGRRAARGALAPLLLRRARADAWRTSLAAGERAQAKYANVEAAGFYARALEAARRLRDVPAEERAPVWEARGDVSELAGLYGEAIEAYRNARRAATSPAPAAQGGHDPGAGRRLRGRAALVPPRSRRRGAGGRARLVVELRVGYAGDALPPGAIRRCDPLVPRRRPARERGRLPARARARLLPPPPRAHVDRAPGARCVPRARAADLRGARRPARAGPRPQQPRDRGVLRGALGRGPRPLRAQQAGAVRGSATSSTSRSSRTTSARSTATRAGSTRRGRCSRRPARSRRVPADSSRSPSRL